MRLLRPKLVIPVGTLAIEQVLGHTGKLVDVVGQKLSTRYHGVSVDVVCLPWLSRRRSIPTLETAAGVHALFPSTISN